MSTFEIWPVPLSLQTESLSFDLSLISAPQPAIRIHPIGENTLCSNAGFPCEFPFPASIPSTLKSRSNSSQARPTPRFSNALRCFDVAARRVGYQESGVTIMRPSESQTSKVCSVTLVFMMSNGGDASEGINRESILGIETFLTQCHRAIARRLTRN